MSRGPRSESGHGAASDAGQQSEWCGAEFGGSSAPFSGFAHIIWCMIMMMEGFSDFDCVETD